MLVDNQIKGKLEFPATKARCEASALVVGAQLLVHQRKLSHSLWGAVASVMRLLMPTLN